MTTSLEYAHDAPVAYASVQAVRVLSRRRTFPYNSICTVSVDRPEHKALVSNTFSGIDTVASLFLSGSETGFLDRGSLVLVLSEPRLSQAIAFAIFAGCRDVGNAYSRGWGERVEFAPLPTRLQQGQVDPVALSSQL